MRDIKCYQRTIRCQDFFNTNHLMENSPKLCKVHMSVPDLQMGQCVQGDSPNTLRKVELMSRRVKIVLVFQIWRLPALCHGKPGRLEGIWRAKMHWVEIRRDGCETRCRNGSWSTDPPPTPRPPDGVFQGSFYFNLFRRLSHIVLFPHNGGQACLSFFFCWILGVGVCVNFLGLLL